MKKARRRKPRTPVQNKTVTLEPLEARLLLASDWQNPINPLNVSDDSFISPLDPLLVINELSEPTVSDPSTGELPPADAVPGAPPPFYDVDGDGFVSPIDAVRGINALGTPNFSLHEGDNFTVTTSRVVALGQETGSRKIEFDINLEFDMTDPSSIVEDTFLVYLVDPADPSQTLLDRGANGTALFSLAGDQMAYVPGLVRYDGTTVQIDVTSLEDELQGQLVFQLINSDGDTETRALVGQISSDVDPDGNANPSFPLDVTTVEPGSELDVSNFDIAQDIETRIDNIRFDSGSGRYTAHLRLTNHGPATGRKVAIAFSSLPPDVELANASGAGADISYLNAAPAIASGGLITGATSNVIRLEINNPNLTRFVLSPQVLVGAPNQAPVLDPIEAVTLMLGDQLELPLTSTDPDDGPLTYSASPLPLPAGASLNAITGEFNFRPGVDQVGETVLTFSVSDGVLTDSETITITVEVPPDGSATGLTGRLLDTNDFVTGIETPVVGATISFLGTGVSVTSDDGGNFMLAGIAGGSQILDIDVSTADPAPDGSPYASFREEIELIDGVTNVVSRPFFLPRVAAESLKTVDPNSTTVVVNPSLDVTLEVPAGSARNADGSFFTGQLSVSEVPEGLAPAALPEELEPGLLVTVQPVGVTFDPPAPIAFPNTDNLTPGSEVDIWSLDPETGTFVVVGTGMVSADGSVIETISGGVRAADWHHVLPPKPKGDDGQNNNDNQDICKCTKKVTASSTAVSSGNLTEEHELVSYRSLGVLRAPRLVYNSNHAHPQPVLSANATIPRLAAVPLMVSSRLTVGGVDVGSEFFTDTSGLNESVDETIRQVVQFDAGEFETGLYPYRFIQTSNYASSSISRSLSGQVLVNNQVGSPFGAGWTLDGLKRLNLNERTVLITDGDGSAKVYQGEALEAPLTTTGVVAEIPSPLSVELHQLESDTEIFVFAENRSLVLDRDLAANITAPGSYSTVASLTPGIVSSGTPIDMFFIHFDTVGRSGLRLQGSVTFNADVLGVIIFDGKLDDSDAFGAADTNYATGQTLRGLEFNPQDYITLEPDGRTLSLDFTVSTGVDQVRVITTADDEGSIQSTFDPPAGDFSSLVQNVDATFTLSAKNGTETHFDSSGLHTSTVDRNGNTTTYVYDTENRLSEIIDPVGQMTTLTYSLGRLASVTDPVGRTTTFEHDLNGNLISITDPDATSREFTYDGHHRMISQTSKRGFASTYEYDFAGRNVRAVRPDGSIWEVSPSETFGLADVAGGIGTVENPAPVVRPDEVIASFVDGNGNVTTYGTNEFGTATAVTDAIGPQPTSTTDENGNPIQVVHPNGALTEMTYDDRGNLLTIRNASGTPIDGQTSLEYEPTFNQVTSVTDELDHVTLYEINPANGNLLSETRVIGQPDSPANGESDDVVTTFTYTAQGLINTITDPLGRMTDNDYDALGRLITTTFAVGTPDEASQLYEYDDAGNLATFVDENGNRTEFEYDSLNRPVRSIAADPDGPSGPLTSPETSFAYDQNGNLLAVTDARSNKTQNVYDPLDRLVQIIDARQEVSQIHYDLVGNPISFLDPLGHETDHEYDSRNRLVETIDPQGARTKFKYDLSDNLTSVTDPRLSETRFDYDARNRLVAEIDPLGNVIQYRHDASDDLTTTIDRNGKATNLEYDDLGRLTHTVDALDKATVTRYDPIGNPIAVTDRRGHITEFEYDDRNRLTRILDPLSNETQFAYDPVGNLGSTTDARGNVSRFEYDALNRQTLVRDALGNETTFSYDPQNNLLTVIDAMLRTTSFSYDELNRRTSTADARNNVTSWEYDPAGNITAFTDPVGNRTTAEFDELNRIIREISSSGIRTFEYDPAGNLSASIDRNGRRREFDHDAINQRTVERWLDPSLATIRTMSYQFDSAGQLIGADDPDSAYTLSYDDVGRVVSSTNAGTPQVPTVALTYDYDAVDNVLSVTDSIAGTLTGETRFEHDPGNRMTQITQSGPQAQDKRVDMFYNELGQFTSIERFSDLSGTLTVARSDYVYDALNRLTSLDYKDPVDAVINSLALEYNPLNRITRMTDIDGTVDYSYDELDQIIGADYGHVTRGDESYQYDENGNRTGSHRHGMDYVTGVNNRLLSDGTFDYEYDAEGSLTKRTEIATGSLREFQYDHRNRLARVTDRPSASELPSQVVRFVYDVFDRRIAKHVDADGAGPSGEQTTRFVYNGINVHLELFDADGTGGAAPQLTTRYLFGPGIDQILAQEDVVNGDVLWHLTNHQGTVTDLVDNMGSTVNQIVYDSYGNIISQSDPGSSSRHLYTGREFDVEVDLYDYRTRYYDSRIGRFISEDPLGQVVTNANLYSYVRNDPMNRVDPLGLYDLPPHDFEFPILPSGGSDDSDRARMSSIFFKRIRDFELQTGVTTMFEGIRVETGAGETSGADERDNASHPFKRDPERLPGAVLIGLTLSAAGYDDETIQLILDFLEDPFIDCLVNELQGIVVHD